VFLPNSRQIGQKYRLPEKYLLFLGTLQPRKNIARLVEAFGDWQRDFQDGRYRAGTGGNRAGFMMQRGYRMSPMCIKPGILTIAMLPRCIRRIWVCDAIALRGIGFPSIGGDACEIPVLCSNTSSLPELAGEAAILVDPASTESIATGIHQLVTDEGLRRSCRARRIQAQKFTWHKAAQAALQVLEEAAQS